MEENKVRFVSSKPYLNVSDAEFDKLLFCIKGRQEIVILCDDELKKELKKLPSDYFILRLSDVKKYLIEKNIAFVEEFNSKDNLKI